MSMVLECGLGGNNCFGTDIFPTRLDFWSRGNPFVRFQEFEWLFMHKRLRKYFKVGGKVVLVFGDAVMEMLSETLPQDRSLVEEHLRVGSEHLEVYTECVFLPLNKY